MGELAAFGKSWWCRGGGAATLLLLVVVSVFRAPRDAIFWAAVAFFAAHTVLTVRRYLVERRHRTTATVIRHHNADVTVAPVVPLRPLTVNSLMPLKTTPKLSKLSGE